MAAVATPQVAPAPRASSGISHPFTCNTCQVAFRSSDLQRTHMQSDWHRYNLKRRVASLPPLTSEIFAEKVLANQASAAATAARASFERLCAPCQRTYFSENAYQNHLGSQKHRLRLNQLANEAASTVDDDVTSMTSSALSLGEPIPAKDDEVYDPTVEAEFSEVVNGIKNTTIAEGGPDPVVRRPTRPHHSAAEVREEHPMSPAKPVSASTTDTESVATEVPPATHTCLFCSMEASSLEANVVHMETTHSLFIPERFYLVDLPGLIEYLYQKVNTLHECLFCGHMKQTVYGIKTHMRDKGHCMIAFDSEEEMIEVGQFYDFRSTYSDDEMEDDGEEKEAAAGGVKLGAKRREVIVDNEDGDEDMEDDGEGWETDDSEEDTAATASKPPRTINGQLLQPIFYDDYELHLPSGRTAGHRSLARYYRQNLTNYPSAVERANQRAIEGTPMAVDGEDGQRDEQRPRGRALAVRNLGMQGVSDVKKREVQAVEAREQKRAQRVQSRYQWGNEKRGNQQKHFRDPLLQ